MDSINKFYEESILFNWSMLKENPNYYKELTSITTFDKLNELYDMYIYFLEKDDYDACKEIKENIEWARSTYHIVIKEKKSL